MTKFTFTQIEIVHDHNGPPPLRPVPEQNQETATPETPPAGEDWWTLACIAIAILVAWAFLKLFGG